MNVPTLILVCAIMSLCFYLEKKERDVLDLRIIHLESKAIEQRHPVESPTIL